jgi:hypothetical protein
VAAAAVDFLPFRPLPAAFLAGFFVDATSMISSSSAAASASAFLPFFPEGTGASASITAFLPFLPEGTGAGASVYREEERRKEK